MLVVFIQLLSLSYRTGGRRQQRKGTSRCVRVCVCACVRAAEARVTPPHIHNPVFSVTTSALNHTDWNIVCY